MPCLCAGRQRRGAGRYRHRAGSCRSGGADHRVSAAVPVRRAARKEVGKSNGEVNEAPLGTGFIPALGGAVFIVW